MRCCQENDCHPRFEIGMAVFVSCVALMPQFVLTLHCQLGPNHGSSAVKPTMRVSWVSSFQVQARARRAKGEAFCLICRPEVQALYLQTFLMTVATPNARVSRMVPQMSMT